MMPICSATVAFAALLTPAAQAQNPERGRTEMGEVVVETLARGLEHP